MHFGRLMRIVFAILVLPSVLSPRVIAAQDEIVPSVVASGLTSPRDFIWAGESTILLAMAGSGGEQASSGDAGEWSGGLTAAIASIDAEGCPVPLATGLPSAIDAAGHVRGAEDLAVLDGQLYVINDGGGAEFGNPDQPAGIYLVYGDGSVQLIADRATWSAQDGLPAVSEGLNPDTSGSSLVADVDALQLWVSDPENGQVVTVAPDGTVTRVADLASQGMVPTRMALNPDGGVYVGVQPASSPGPGSSAVVAISASGEVSEVWAGLTDVVDVVVDSAGTLYALERSSSDEDSGSGRLVRQSAQDELEVIASGLTEPIAMETGPDEAIYVSAPATGATAGEGKILRIAPNGSPSPRLSPEGCAPLPETLGTGAVAADIDPDPEPADAPTAESPTSEPIPVATTDPAAVMREVQVGVVDITFQPAVITIPAGTTIRFTNMDEVDHTATGINWEFDTGVIAPGESVTVTLDSPGTYVYFSQFYPEAQATIIVE